MNDERSHPPGPGAIRLRAEEGSDEPLLLEWYASTRAEELAMTGWDSATRAAFLNMQFRAMRQGYRAMFPQGQFSIILVEGIPVGRMVVDRSEKELHLVDLVVSPARRNCGIGTTLMKALMAEGAQAGKPVRLQVLKNSRAIGLYERLGFSRAGETDIYAQMEWRANPAPEDLTRVPPGD